MKKLILLIQVTLLFLFITDVFSQWYPQNSGGSKVLWGVSFPNVNTGIIVGGWDTYPPLYTIKIFRTTNGGMNWTSQTTENWLFDVCFTDTNTGTAVGGFETILRTTNGGINWISQSPLTTYEYRDVSLYEYWGYEYWGVSFTDANTGTVVGSNGRIIRTTNSGINWTLQTSGTGNWLYDVYFTDANIGTVVGDPGTILRTTNGGTNWTPQSSGTTNDLWGVFFIDANTGTAVGWHGTILRTTNGGANWISQTSGTPSTLYSVYFTDANTGTAVGGVTYGPGVILRTTNKGINWSLQTIEIAWCLLDVDFINANTGSVVGDKGIILRTTNGGVSFINQISSEVPERFSLYQNYPNPFNPATNIKFDIQKTSPTKLIIYDALGREVAILVNEVLNAGSYQVDWNASEHPSGVYFYMLQAGDYKETKKMLMIK